MAAAQRDLCIESALPVVSANGLNTLQNINFNSGSNSCDLPAATTLNGSAISAQGNVTGTNTTGATFSVTNTGIYAGVGAFQVIGDSGTTGVITLISGNGLTTGTALSVTSSGTIATTGNLVLLTASGLTTGTGINMGALQALTTGTGIKIAHTTSVIADGGSLVRLTSSSIDTGGATNGTILDMKGTAQLAGTMVRLDSIQTTGTAMSVISTGVMTTTGNLLTLTANSATTAAGILRVNGTGLTTGLGAVITTAYGTLTTGRYLSMNDGTSAVLSFGENGHIHTLLGGATAPVMASVAAHGITAAAIVAGSTDVAGGFTTTGTQDNSTDSTISLTFNKTYTAAPKTVLFTALNAAAASGQIYISSISATVVTIGFAKNAAWGATPSYGYLVVA